MSGTSPARRLAQQIGITIPALCKRARISPAYFARIARHGNVHEDLAMRLSQILNVNPVVFLWGLPYYDQHYAALYGAIGEAEDAQMPTPGNTISAATDVARSKTRRRRRPLNTSNLKLVE